NTVENQSDSISTGIEQEEYGEKTSLEYIVQQVQQDIHALSKIVQSLVDTNEKYQTQYSTMHDKIQNVYHEIHAIRTKMEQDNTESQYTINEEWSVEEKGDGGEDIHDALYDSVNESQEIHYTSNNTDENGNEVYLSQDEITGQNEDRSEEYLEENSSSLEQPKHEDVVSREQFEVLEGNVASLYDITQQIKDSLEELQSSIATMNSSDIHVVSTSSNAIPTSSFSIQSLQTWIQSIQGLPEEFTQAITVLSIEYNGSEKSVDTPFATTYGTAFISFSGEIHYTPNDTLAYQEGVVYTENFTCVLNNIEQLSLSLSFSLSISLVSSVLHVVISPVIQYVYLHDNHGLLIDIEIRNPAIGDVLYSTSARENMYKYKLSSEQHCIIQDIESIEESEEIAHNFHIRVNPNIQHQRYILVHIYGYIAGIQYNDSHIYTIEYKEGVLDYPILSSQKIAHFESIPQHSAEQESLATSENSDTQVVDAHFEEESPQEEVYKARGEENKIYDETPIDEVYQSDEYDVNTPLEDTEYSSEEGDEHTLFDGTHDEHDEYSDALAYEEHSPYQEEYYPSDDEYSYGTFEEENEEEESLFSQEQVEHSHEMPVDALHTTVFMKEAIAQYALQHTLTVDHCICNGIVYSVQEVWLSRYGMVCVYSDGSVSYALQPYVQTGLLYKTVYDVFTCVLYDEEGRQIDVEMAFELRPTQEGVVFSEVDVKTIPVEDMPALRTFTVKASLSHTAQTDYLLMIETYTQPYIYSQDIHSIYISFLSTMEAVEEFIKNVVVYIPSPETNLNSRSVSITIEGYHNGEYIANVEHFHVIPEQGKEYYYATDFMTHTNTNSEQLEEYLEHEQNIAESTSHEPSYEISEERKEHDDMYDDYARYDDYENGVEEEAEDIRNENESHLPVGSGDIDLKSESEDSAVNTIPRENVFTVEDALMCKRISSKDIRLSGITGDSVVLVGDGWNISNTPHKVYLQGCVYNTYGISSREGEYNVFIPEGVHVTYREQ
ncbi:MAG: hypothetical protein K2M30_01580, partial [Desulfovibrionaceae bacterium]|nr:hypothetical protein [Desulfovibrionaceae bacterium]